jgi:hypothetical protein
MVLEQFIQKLLFLLMKIKNKLPSSLPIFCVSDYLVSKTEGYLYSEETLFRSFLLCVFKIKYGSKKSEQNIKDRFGVGRKVY